MTEPAKKKLVVFCVPSLAGPLPQFIAALEASVPLIEAATRLSPFPAEPSGAMLINCTKPAVAAAGDKMLNAYLSDLFPDKVSRTAIWAEPAVLIFALSIETFRNSELTNSVAIGFPFHSTSELLVKFDPTTWSVNGSPPAIA